MSDFGTRMYVAGYYGSFTFHARNTVTGEKRDVTVHAADAMAATARFFRVMDAESGDRSWCFDRYTRED